MLQATSRLAIKMSAPLFNQDLFPGLEAWVYLWFAGCTVYGCTKNPPKYSRKTLRAPKPNEKNHRRIDQNLNVSLFLLLNNEE